MFGLDARIALAIFGALSIITGATLDKIIQHIQFVATYHEVEELIKALNK